MACEFQVEGNVEQARKAVTDGGGAFDGTEEYGVFSGKGVEGFYRRVKPPNGYHVVIYKKPWYASCARIEKEIRKAFE